MKPDVIIGCHFHTSFLVSANSNWNNHSCSGTPSHLHMKSVKLWQSSVLSGWLEQQKTSAGTWRWCAPPCSSTPSPLWPSPSCTSTTPTPLPVTSTKSCCGSTWDSVVSCPSLPSHRVWNRVSRWNTLTATNLQITLSPHPAVQTYTCWTESCCKLTLSVSPVKARRALSTHVWASGLNTGLYFQTSTGNGIGTLLEYLHFVRVYGL